jgi:hypothetical protein
LPPETTPLSFRAISRGFIASPDRRCFCAGGDGGTTPRAKMNQMEMRAGVLSWRSEQASGERRGLVPLRGARSSHARCTVTASGLVSAAVRPVISGGIVAIVEPHPLARRLRLKVLACFAGGVRALQRTTPTRQSKTNVGAHRCSLGPRETWELQYVVLVFGGVRTPKHHATIQDARWRSSTLSRV